LWFGLSAILIHYRNWWPKPGDSFWAYLYILLALMPFGAAIIAFIDWYAFIPTKNFDLRALLYRKNRFDFEEAVVAVLKSVDFPKPVEYYSRSPASGVWILEYDDKFVGLLALDASLDSEVIRREESVQLVKNKNKKSTSETATIRHFYIEEQYRSTKIQDDLLAHALNHAFSEPKVQHVKATEPTLLSYIGACLQRAGFTRDEGVKATFGFMGWEVYSQTLERERWVRKQAPEK
jgi:GNAT superfamily N-acetyltransferase